MAAGRGRTTINDIAAAAGVSIMTVSRAMRGVEGVSAAKRAEILSLAQAMQYAPNRIAGSLATDNSRLIGVSFPTLFDTVFADIFNGMREHFHKAGLETVVDTTDYDAMREESWVSRLIAWRPAGIVLTGGDHRPAMRDRLAHAAIPTVELWDVVAEPIDCSIGIDHRGVGQDMARHAIALGYREAVIIGTEHGRDLRAERRFEGFSQTFECEGLQVHPPLFEPAASSFEAGREGAHKWISGKRRERSILYCLNDYMAFGAMMACEAAGLDVPGDVGIAGFNDLRINEVLNRPITTTLTPRRTMGERAAQMLVARINGVGHPTRETMVTTIREGATTRRYD